MFRIVLLFAFITACCSHAVLPLAHHVPAVHTAVVPVGGLYSQGYAGPGHLGYLGSGHLSHGYGALSHGYLDHGYLSHGYGAKPLVHHLLKRSPHLVHPVGHIAPIVVAPAAVSHQSRVDVHTSSPVIAPIVAPPVLHAAPLLHKPLLAPLAPLHYGIGHYGSAYPHWGHYY